MTKTADAVGVPVTAQLRRPDVACFTKGTLVATPFGERPVETLNPGDRVFTRDNGARELRWIGWRTIGWSALMTNPQLKPVLVKEGALGPGTPSRDLYVSPNHRMLVIDARGDEVLVAAKDLVGTPGITCVESMGVTYLHLLFDAHEVILSDGAWSESFQPSDFALGTFGNGTRSEILALFPELGSAEAVDRYQLARRLTVVAQSMGRV